MSSEARRYIRIYHKDLKDYKVVIEKFGSSFKGELGNISEGGCCVILPKGAELQRGEVIRGNLYYIHDTTQCPFEGRVAWISDYEHGGRIHSILGLEFTSPVNLPEHLLALSMSLE